MSLPSPHPFLLTDVLAAPWSLHVHARCRGLSSGRSLVGCPPQSHFVDSGDAPGTVGVSAGCPGPPECGLGETNKGNGSPTCGPLRVLWVRTMCEFQDVVPLGLLGLLCSTAPDYTVGFSHLWRPQVPDKKTLYPLLPGWGCWHLLQEVSPGPAWCLIQLMPAAATLSLCPVQRGVTSWTTAWNTGGRVGRPLQGPRAFPSAPWEPKFAQSGFLCSEQKQAGPWSGGVQRPGRSQQSGSL